MEKWKSRDVIGEYILERYWVGGFAVAGMMDSSGTDMDVRTVAWTGGEELVFTFELDEGESWNPDLFCEPSTAVPDLRGC
jgi:hypothetical protein